MNSWNRNYPWRPRFLGCIFLACALAAAAVADPARLLILHTNDLHDHVRAGENGLGGLPYVSGYIKQVRAERDDVLVLDAGDVAEKGDLVAFRTHGVMTFEAMARIGYDAVTIGNHDFDDVPMDRIREFERALGSELLCLNIVRPDGTAVWTGSRIVEKGGLRIGLIGMIVPRKPGQGGLDAEASGRALALEEAKLREAGAALVVAVCHESVRKCADWSQAAPGVQVFVSGHSHEVIMEPVVVPETGAIIVQAGSYARWVGRLELEIDPEARTILSHKGRLVPMRHSEIPMDAEMLAWVREREQSLAPEASEFVFENPSEIDGFSVARLAAEALRLAAGADIGFCHAYQVIRETLPPGPIDVNAIFKTGGHRGAENVLLDLSGAEIDAYVNALQYIQNEGPEWAGFRLRRVASPTGEALESDLEPTRRYRVVMPRIEWETRFLRLADKIRERDPANPIMARTIAVEPIEVTFTDALHAYIRQVLADGDTVQERALKLAAKREI